MTARELITKTAEEAGFVNKSTEDERRHWNVDQWKLARRTLRVHYDGLGRVRAASWGSGSKTRNFIGKGLKDKIVAKALELGAK